MVIVEGADLRYVLSRVSMLISRGDKVVSRNSEGVELFIEEMILGFAS